MTLLALPKPGPPLPVGFARARLSAPRIPARLSPNSDEPPTRMKSRRVTPSQVSLPEKPGMANMRCSPFGNGRAVRWDGVRARRAGGLDYPILYAIGLQGA